MNDSSGEALPGGVPPRGHTAAAGPRDAVVFGGTGFIGSHLVRRLLSGGFRVRVATRRALPRSPNASLTYVTADITDAQTAQDVVDGASTVFHLASGGGESWSDFQRDFEQGTENVASACLRQGVRRLIYTSSIEALYLGDPGALTEEAGVDPEGHRRGFYSRGKIAAEAVLRRMQARDRLAAVIFRPGVVMGEGGTLNHPALGTWESDTCCVGWGAGDTPLPFVLVEDVAEALFAAAELPGIDGMTFNLVGDVRPSASEFVRILAHQSARNFRFYPRTAAVAFSIELSTWLLKRAAGKRDPQRYSLRQLKSSSLRAWIDCSAARRVLGWNPVADRDEFVRRAILPHLKPVPSSDLRLTPFLGS